MIGERSHVMIQGITGREGAFHTKQMLEYGTKVVAGVTPGRGGASVEGVPVYNSVRDAVSKHPQIECSVLFVPPAFAFDAALESIDAGIRWTIMITEGVPVRDSMWLINYAKSKGCKILGPNCPGMIIPGKAKMGIMPRIAFSPGRVGLVSRSGTLTYEAAFTIKRSGMGISRAIGIGGDPIIGSSMLEMVQFFESDQATEAVVILGEIGGRMEEDVAAAISAGQVRKPVVAYVAGFAAPQGKRMGHAGAIMAEGQGTAKEKLESLRSAGANVAERTGDLPRLIRLSLDKKR